MNETIIEQHMPTIYTTSLWAAAYAMTRGARLLGVYVRTGQHFRNAFVLSNENGIALQAVDDWWTDDPLVHARALMSARLELLNRMRKAEQASLQAMRGA